MPRGVPPQWTTDTLYAIVKAFTLAEGRYPSRPDFARQSHGLPLSTSTLYRWCPDWKQRLARDGIVHETPSPAVPRHPWRQTRAVSPGAASLSGYGLAQQSYVTRKH